MIRKIGEKNCINLFTSGRFLTSEEGLKIGLIDYVVNEDNLDNKLIEVLLPYKNTAPLATINSKKLVKNIMPKIDDTLINFTIEELANTWENIEANEGIRSFFNKTKPNWIERK